MSLNSSLKTFRESVHEEVTDTTDEFTPEMVMNDILYIFNSKQGYIAEEEHIKTKSIVTKIYFIETRPQYDLKENLSNASQLLGCEENDTNEWVFTSESQHITISLDELEDTSTGDLYTISISIENIE